MSRLACKRCTTECAAVAGKSFAARMTIGWKNTAMYHRKDGLLVKEGDDAISASRYALMMKRHGQSDAGRASFNREIVYPRQSIA